MAKDLISAINTELKRNNNKISPDFIGELLLTSTVQYLHPTPTMRLCIITLESGHEVIGKAQVLDPTNDVEEIGNKVAYTNATDEIWAQVGSIAKALL